MVSEQMKLGGQIAMFKGLNWCTLTTSAFCTLTTSALKRLCFTTVQLGYCDSDVTDCLLFWDIPIVNKSAAGIA